MKGYEVAIHGTVFPDTAGYKRTSVFPGFEGRLGCKTTLYICGYHFCRNMKDALALYDIDKSNIDARGVTLYEVDARGTIDHGGVPYKEAKRSSCTRITYVREVPRSEYLHLLES